MNLPDIPIPRLHGDTGDRVPRITGANYLLIVNSALPALASPRLKSMTTMKTSVPRHSFSNYGREPASIDHNGIVAHVEYGNGDALTVGGRSYGLVSMHVHVHAEHQVDRELFPAEMHLVHSTNEGLLAVVGQIYRLGAADPTIQALIDAYPQPGSTAQSPHNLNSAGFPAVGPGLLSLRRFSHHSPRHGRRGLVRFAGTEDDLAGAGQPHRFPPQRFQSPSNSVPKWSFNRPHRAETCGVVCQSRDRCERVLATFGDKVVAPC